MRSSAKHATIRSRDRAGPTPAQALPVGLLLIDDNRLRREGLAAMIRSRPEFLLLAAASDVTEAAREAGSRLPDLILLDRGQDSREGLARTVLARETIPHARLVVMGLPREQSGVADYVRAGAVGFIMRDASFEECATTIRAVAGGTKVLPRALTPGLFSQLTASVTTPGRPRRDDADRLTGREREIVDLIGEGLRNKEIAARLEIAVDTVKSHVHNVLEKLALRSRLEIAAFARREAPPGPGAQ